MIYSESLKKNKDFHNVYQSGKSMANRFLVLYYLANNSNQNRIGISVSKKVGNSVIRHRLTRLIRESYRLNEEKCICGCDIVIIARPGSKECTFREIESALIHLLGLQNLIKKNV